MSLRHPIRCLYVPGAAVPSLLISPRKREHANSRPPLTTTSHLIRTFVINVTNRLPLSTSLNSTAVHSQYSYPHQGCSAYLPALLARSPSGTMDMLAAYGSSSSSDSEGEAGHAPLAPLVVAPAASRLVLPGANALFNAVTLPATSLQPALAAASSSSSAAAAATASRKRAAPSASSGRGGSARDAGAAGGSAGATAKKVKPRPRGPMAGGMLAPPQLRRPNVVTEDTQRLVTESTQRSYDRRQRQAAVAAGSGAGAATGVASGSGRSQ